MNQPIASGFDPISLGLPEAVLRPGETLVAVNHHPVAFPGVLDEAPSAVLYGPGDASPTEDRWYREVGLRCRRSVAQWIGVHFEALYGDAQVKYEWDGDILTIDDDPWEYDGGPRSVWPDADGLYLIKEPWLTVSANYAVEFYRRHPAALAHLAGDEKPSAAADAMLDYLADVPKEKPRRRARIKAILADRLPN